MVADYDEYTEQWERDCTDCGRRLPISAFRPASNWYTRRCRKCWNKRAYQQRDRQKARDGINQSRLRLKRAVMDAYGGRCDCCGVVDLIFLNIDHVDRDGAAHRIEIKASSSSLYIWLRQNGYPPGFRVLCFNCNFAEYHGGCPHGALDRTKSPQERPISASATAAVAPGGSAE